MDKARGGYFVQIPMKGKKTNYPAKAWYTYSDQSCNYDCMIIEYIYWSLSSMLGAQKLRYAQIGTEYRLNTRARVQKRDPKVFNLLTKTKYHLPTVLPTGA